MRGKNRTNAENKRFDQIQQRGCVPCYLEAKLQSRVWLVEPCDIHHTEGQNHSLTYGNCPWHHRGLRKIGVAEWIMVENFGPSMAKSPKAYRARYGSESDILAIQNKMLLKSVEQL